MRLRLPHFLPTLSLAAKISAVIVVGMVLIMSGVSTFAVMKVRGSFDEVAMRATAMGVAHAWELLRREDRHGAGFRVYEGKLYVGVTRLNDDETIVDAVSQTIGGAATIVLGDEQIATSVQDGGRRAVGTRLTNPHIRRQVLEEGTPYRGEAEILGQRYMTAYEPIMDAQGTAIGILFVGQSLQAIEAAMQRLTLELLGITVAVSVFGGLAAFAVTRRSLRPLTDMRLAMARLADGDLAVDVPARGRGDEIGAMAVALQVFKDNACERERLRAEARAVDEAAAAQRRGMMAGVACELETAVGGVINELSLRADEVLSSSHAMSSVAEQTNQRSEAVATAANEAAANVTTVSTAAEELSTAIALIARRVAQSAEIAISAGQEAEKTREAMASLARCSETIGEVVGLIRDIAGKTNLLALNATIEAARAGEAGKSFAVVAAEVKSLANQTAQATQDIGGQIAAMQAATSSAVAAIERIAQTVITIEGLATEVAGAVEQQQAATHDIARNVEQAALGTRDVSANMESLRATASSSGSAAGHLAQAAAAVRAQTATLQREVERFVSTVRQTAA